LIWVFVVGTPTLGSWNNPLSPQQKTRNERFGFFYFFPLQKFTFEREEEIKKQSKFILVWVFVVGIQFTIYFILFIV
jgi:hypothetical protein